MKEVVSAIIKSAVWNNPTALRTLLWLINGAKDSLVEIPLHDKTEEKKQSLMDILKVLDESGFIEYKVYPKYVRVVLTFSYQDAVVMDGKGLSEFAVFHKAYPGTKRTVETEFALFKKNKNWKEILPMLMERLGSQIKQREMISSSGAFVPEWKHLQTYIRNKGWEEVYSFSSVQQAKADTRPVIRPRG